MRAFFLVIPLLVLKAWLPAAERHFELEMEAATSNSGTVEVFFDLGNGFSAESSVRASIAAGERSSLLRFELPFEPIKQLRIDPPDGGITTIHSIRLVDEAGRVVLTIDPRSLRKMNEIASLESRNGGVRVTLSSGAVDPMLLVDAPLHEATERALGRRPLTVPFILAAGGLAGILTILALAIAYLSHGRGVGRWGAVVFMCVLGSRLYWLNAFARPLPFWDEWEGDGHYLLTPLGGGFLDWRALLLPQGEHRIVLMRLITLVGAVLNGEWDPRVAMTLGAAMVAAGMALVAVILVRGDVRLGRWAALIVAAGTCLPFDFTNLLWGGETQMYTLQFFALLVLALAASKFFDARVQWALVIAAVLSLGTMGSGFVAPAAAACICATRAFYERQQRLSLARMAVLLGVIALTAWCLRGRSPAHAELYVKSSSAFFHAWIGALAWPLAPGIISVVLLWLPWSMNGVAILKKRGGTSLEWLAVGLGAWALANATALAYARPYEGPPFDARFFTALSMGALSTLGSTVAWCARSQFQGLRAGSVVMLAAVAFGWIWMGIQGVDGSRAFAAEHDDCDHRVRQYLSTGNSELLEAKYPHWNYALVKARLDSPLLRRSLPAPYRRALASRENPGAAAQIFAGPLTLAARDLMRAGPWIAWAGLLAFGAATWSYRRRCSRIPI